MSNFTLTVLQQQSLLALARESVSRRLMVDRDGPPFTDDPLFNEPLGAFVTLHLSGMLRGCIGMIETEQPLRETVREMALAAAFRDPRFPPVQAGEFARLDFEISILSPVVPLDDPALLRVGEHGLIVSRGGRKGLLLPQVPLEQGWDREQFLRHCCLKAGLPPDAWEVQQPEPARLEIFTAFVFGENG